MKAHRLVPLFLFLPCISAHAAEQVASTSTSDEIVVNADVLPAPAGKNTVNGKNIRQLAGSSGDPLNVLQSLPGVATVDGTSAPAVRGSGPGDNLYYVDDLLINNLFHFNSISVFNADLIDSFNLYSSVTNPHYGDITGAVIDVKLRDPRNDKIGGKFDVNLMGAGLLVEGPSTDNQSFFLSVRRSYIDLFVKQIANNGITLQIPNYTDYQGKYLWQLNENNRVTFHAMGSTDKLKFNLSGSANAAQIDPVLAGDSAFSDQNSLQAVTLDSTLSDYSSNTAYLSHSSDYASTLLGTAGVSNVTTNNLTLHEKYSVSLAGENDVSFGGDLTNSATNVNASFKNATCTQFNPNCTFTTAPLLQLNNNFSTNLWDLAAQDRKHLTPAFTLIAGVRYNTENYAHKSYLEPRIGMEWQWSKQTLFNAGFGEHNQYPTALEWGPVFGNPNLNHLRSQDSVLGVQHKVDADWNWKAETYYKKLSNLVVNDPLFNYINTASGKAYGLELLLKKEETENLSGWFVINLARSERTNDVTGQSFRYQYDQPINTTLVGNYKLNDDIKLGMKWAYHSGTPYTPITGTNGTYANGGPVPVYAAVNSDTLPVYHRLDLRLDRKVSIFDWKLDSYFELNDVYQRKNVVGYNYTANFTTRTPIYSFVLPISFGLQGEF